jgi:hypothetical protein
MQTAISKLTKKYQATISGLIRMRLSLKSGGAVAFDLEWGRIPLAEDGAMNSC